MKKWNKQILAIAAAVGLGAASMASGVFAGPPGDGYGPGYGYEQPEKDGAKRAERWKGFMEKRHAELHGKLKLAASQEGAWKTYTDATMANMTPPKPQDRGDFDSISAPERMEKAIDMMKERQARMESQLAALKTFYATLTPEQQKVFDAETSPKAWKGKGWDRLKKKPAKEDS